MYAVMTRWVVNVGTGASDCASCVGVLLELARVLVENPAIKLTSPVVFLFNGAEETFLQARVAI